MPEVSWVAVPCDLVRHPRTTALRRMLEDSAAEVYLVRLWCWAKFYEPIHGDLSAHSDADLEGVAEWPGQPGILMAALKASGWVTAERALAGWYDLNGWLAEKAAKERKRKRDEYARNRGENGPSVSVGRSVGRSVGGKESPRRSLKGSSSSGKAAGSGGRRGRARGK